MKSPRTSLSVLASLVKLGLELLPAVGGGKPTFVIKNRVFIVRKRVDASDNNVLEQIFQGTLCFAQTSKAPDKVPTSGESNRMSVFVRNK